MTHQLAPKRRRRLFEPLPKRWVEKVGDEFLMRDEQGQVVCRGREGDAIFAAYEPMVVNGIYLQEGDSVHFSTTEPQPLFARHGFIGYILRFLLPPRNRTGIIGDLLEEYCEVERERGTWSALRLCAWDAFRSVIRLAIIAKIVHWFSQWAK